MKRLFCLILAIEACLLSSAAYSTDSLLSVLDDAIARRAIYEAANDGELRAIHAEVSAAADPVDRFEIYGRLFDRYKGLNADSALLMASRRLEIARHMADTVMIDNARLNRADILMQVGMYKEAFDIVLSISPDSLPQYLVPYYYYVRKTLLALMADYAVEPQLRAAYRREEAALLDTLLNVNRRGTAVHAMLLGDKLTTTGQPDSAVTMLTAFLDTASYNLHEAAALYFTLAEANRATGNRDAEKQAMIQSATADMRSGIREYLSLRRLALILFHEGDIDNAYRYLQICIADANDVNARLRVIELNEIIPVISQAYLDNQRYRQEAQRRMLIISASLLVCLLFALFFIYQANRRLRQARRQSEDANRALTILNSELTDRNERLAEAKAATAEASLLKEEYIGRYMDQCSVYIEKLDEYRKSLARMLAAGENDRLKSSLKSTNFLDDEVRAFHEQFDKTFLELFPSFVEDFNKLLQPDEQISPKRPGSLTTELRIFALIRLGIDDSVKIAQFLRYSVTTIYNYRTKVRNKAIGSRDQLETALMQIGRN